MRRAALLVILLLSSPAAARAEEAPRGAEASVAISAPKQAYVGQTFGLFGEVAYRRAWFTEHAARLFHQSMDVPLHVDAPWLRGLPGATVTTMPPVPTLGSVTIAVNDAVVPAEAAELKGMEVLSLEASCRVDRPGPLRIPAPTLRFSWAERFEDDPVLGRVAIGAREAVIRGDDAIVDVLPLPQEGRPPEFEGVVGSYRVSAEADVESVEIGTAFSLTLVIEGEPSLRPIPAPRLDGLAEFHVLGTIVDDGRITYSVAATDASVREIPAIPFAFFDPEAKAYRVVRTQPIPLEVRAKPGAPMDEPVFPRPPPASRPEIPVTPPWRWAVLGIATLVFTLLVPVLIRRRARRGNVVLDPARARLAAALDALRATSPDDPAAFADALAEVLAARLGLPAAAAISPDLESRLVRAGVPADLAARASAALSALVSSRYGGVAPGPGGLSTLAADLDAFLRHWVP